MTSLIVKQDGLIYVNEFPVKPEFKGDYFLHYGPQKKYEAELNSAIDTAILCADQEQATWMILETMNIVGYTSREDITLQEYLLKTAKKDHSYPIPGLKFEVTCKWKGNLDACGNETCWDLCECQKNPQVAILSVEETNKLFKAFSFKTGDLSYNGGYSHMIQGRTLHIIKNEREIVLDDNEIMKVLEVLGIATSDFKKGFEV